MITILFPTIGNDSELDLLFQNEYNAANECGFDIRRIDGDFYFGGDGNIYGKDDIATELTLFRGWITKPEYYDILNASVLKKNSSLIVSPEHHSYCHNFPDWYNSDIKKYTPDSISFSDLDVNNIFPAIKEHFGDSPLILKDYHKSRKQDWFDACFIQCASDFNDVKRVVNNFIDIMGDTLFGGLVFRKFEKFKQIGIHPKSKMPLINEFRKFYYNGIEFHSTEYWDNVSYNLDYPSKDFTDNVIKNVKCPFFTADFAQLETGDWRLIEIGEGGACGIPGDTAKIQSFYSSLRSII